MNKLRVDNLSVSLQGEEILKGISYEFHSDKIYAVFGKSGSGKSTLLKSLCRLMAYNGDIYLNNSNTDAMKPQLLRKNVQYLHQEAVLFQGTVMDNFRMLSGFRFNNDLNFDKDYAVSLMEKLSLGAGYLDKDTGKLSGGEKQRVAIVRSLIMNPVFLLMDEPTSALDIGNESKVLDLMESLKPDIGVIIVTHSLPFIKNADIKLHMEKGGIVKEYDEIADTEIKKVME